MTTETLPLRTKLFRKSEVLEDMAYYVDDNPDYRQELWKSSRAFQTAFDLVRDLTDDQVVENKQLILSALRGKRDIHAINRINGDTYLTRVSNHYVAAYNEVIKFVENNI